MIIGKYKLQNEEKVDRALNGNERGIGGVKKADGTYDEKELLVEYDKIGGYITDMEGSKVKTGCFYDVKTKKAHENPKVILLFNVNGDVVEVEEGKKAPGIIEAVKIVEKAKKKAEEKSKKARRR